MALKFSLKTISLITLAIVGIVGGSLATWHYRPPAAEVSRDSNQTTTNDSPQSSPGETAILNPQTEIVPESTPPNAKGRQIPQTNATPKPPEPDKELIIEVWADTAGESVNVVQADLTYPPNELKVISFSAGPGFPNSAQSTDKAGTVSISRFTDPGTSVKGVQLVARIVFERTTANTTPKVPLSAESKLIRSSDSKNIIGVVPGAKLYIK